MKTAKKITKKAIIATLRTLDRTAIFKLCVALTGPHPRPEIKSWVFNMIKQYASTNAIAKQAFNIAFGGRNTSAAYKGKHGYFAPLPYQEIVDYTKQQLRGPVTPYTKYPMYGHTHLYFCSPVHGHSDYNKWRALPIEGNEKFCKTLVDYVTNVTKIYNATIRVRVWQRRTNDYEKEKFNDIDIHVDGNRKTLWVQYSALDAKFARQNADYVILIINNENHKYFCTDTVVRETFYNDLTKIN